MKNVTFNLGPSDGITARQLTIRRMPGAGDDTIPIAPQYDQDEGAVSVATVALPDNQMWQAVLVDTGPGGVDRPGQVLNFHTGSLTYLGPTANEPEGSQFGILDTDDLSSSSSSSVSSISTSSDSSSDSSSSRSQSSESSSSQSMSESSSASSGSSGL